MIDNIDKTIAKQLSAEVEEALKPLAEKHGLVIESRGGSFDSGSFNPKIALKTSGADEAEFNRYAAFEGLEGKFGATFEFNGTQYKVVGYAPRSLKRPVLCEQVGTTRRFKFTVDAVKKLT